MKKLELLLCTVLIMANLLYAAATQEEPKKEVKKELSALQRLTKYEREEMLSHLGYKELINLAHATTNQDLLNSIKAKIDNRPLIRYWAAGKIKIVGIFEGNFKASSLAFSPDGIIIANSTADHIKLTRLPDKKTIRRIHFAVEVKAIAFTNAGNLLTFEKDSFGRTYIISEKTIEGKTIQSKSLPITFNENIECSAAAFSINGQWLAIGFAEGTIRIIDVQKNKEIQTLPSSHGKIESFAISCNGTRLAATFSKGMFLLQTILYDIQTAQETGKFLNTAATAFSPDGQLLAIFLDSPAADNLLLFEVQSGEIIRSINMGGGRHSLAFSYDGKKLAIDNPLGGIISVLSIVHN